MRIFDSSDEEALGAEWVDAVELFAEAVVLDLIPVSVPVTIDGELSLVTVVFPPTGHTRVTATCADPMVRARLAAALMMAARSRIISELGEDGVVPVEGRAGGAFDE